MNFPDVLESKAFKYAVFTIAAFIILLAVFRAGVLVGFRKASFSSDWSENYHRNFAGPRRGFMHGGPWERKFIAAHGVFGQVISNDGNDMTIEGSDDVERIVVFGPGAKAMRFDRPIAPKEILPGEFVVILGAPAAAGQIDAKLVRVMPPPGHQPFFVPIDSASGTR
jgi:hypothetical protein